MSQHHYSAYGPPPVPPRPEVPASHAQPQHPGAPQFPPPPGQAQAGYQYPPPPLPPRPAAQATATGAAAPYQPPPPAQQQPAYAGGYYQPPPPPQYQSAPAGPAGYHAPQVAPGPAYAPYQPPQQAPVPQTQAAYHYGPPPAGQQAYAPYAAGAHQGYAHPASAQPGPPSIAPSQGFYGQPSYTAAAQYQPPPPTTTYAPAPEAARPTAVAAVPSYPPPPQQPVVGYGTPAQHQVPQPAQAVATQPPGTTYSQQQVPPPVQQAPPPPPSTAYNQYQAPASSQPPPTPVNNLAYAAPPQHQAPQAAPAPYAGYPGNPPGATAYFPPPPPPPGPPSAASTPSTYVPTPASTPSVSNPPAAPASDPLAGISSQFGNMRVSSTPQFAAPPRPKHAPLPAPFIRDNGVANEVLFDCPETTGIDYALLWYRLPAVPEFLVCSFCHQKHIKDTAHASAFERVQRSAEEVSLCRFWVPRVTEALWPAAIKSGDLKDIQDFMTNRLKVLDCPGLPGAPAEAGIKWFRPIEGDLASFTSCQGCHEDRIIGSAFEHRFAAAQAAQKEGETWGCDISNAYIHRALKEFGTGGMNNWPGLKAVMTKRGALPACDGAAAPLDSKQWYVTRRPIKSFMVCETCFCDKVALTEFEAEFQPYAPPAKSKTDTFASLLGAVLSGNEAAASAPLYVCDLAVPSQLVALSCALARHDFNVFWTAAGAILSAPPCSAEAAAGGTWYALHASPDGAAASPDFRLCAACHAGYMVPSGMGRFFKPAAAGPGGCALHTAAPRFAVLLAKFAEAVTTGVLAPFSGYAAKFGGVGACTRDAPVTNGRWWGFPDALFCQECYLLVAADSALDSALPVRGAREPQANFCCLYSPRMRRLWSEACAAGSAEAFVAAAHERQQVYLAVRPQIEYISAMRRIKTQQAMHQGLLSVMYQGSASIRNVAGTTDGHLHGNNSLGWHNTWEGAESARLSESMSAGLREANRGDDVMRIVQLEALWRQVE